ncbi:hypothetical protein [Saccharopolyspora cebuensis]|uniref:DNA-binding transcriptional regulator of glucitol operon n=1 Tax=Saccharopolyspora cebuensis TaxID=418759 RepID=A0ABV4CHC5_9PSEU
MKRSLLTPRWLLLHALFVVAFIATCFLAVWQWERAHDAGGSFQNLGYALQWPLFGVFTLFLWVRMARMTLHDEAEAAAGQAEDTAGQEPAEEPERAARAGRPRPLVPPQAPPVDPDEDPELAAYNRYLAELNEAEGR